MPVPREELVDLVPEDNRRLVFLGNLVHERNELLRVAVVRGPDVTDGRRNEGNIVSRALCLDCAALGDVCFTRTCRTVRYEQVTTSGGDMSAHTPGGPKSSTPCVVSPPNTAG